MMDFRAPAASRRGADETFNGRFPFKPFASAILADFRMHDVDEGDGESIV